ncbi:lipid A-modifier LpxR family protein, partial [Stutzerimonas stutzeri]
MKYLSHLRPRLLAMLFVASAAAEADTLSIKAENDIISSGSDGHYSNGLEVIWGFEPEQDHWSRSVADLLPTWSGSAVDNVAYRFGHQIYTPEEIENHG